MTLNDRSARRGLARRAGVTAEVACQAVSHTLAIDGKARHTSDMPSMARQHADGPARLLDVANAAGVSLRTASRVLNDDPRVAPVTR